MGDLFSCSRSEDGRKSSRKAPQLCVDAGGNVGSYASALLSKFPNTRIVIFEPANKNVEILRQKFDNDPRISVAQLALSDKQGETHLFSNEEGSGLASLTKRRLNHFGISFSFSEQVFTQRFDDYWTENLNRQEISLLKLDIEGHELEALKGMEKSLAHISLIQFEFGGCNIDTKTYFQDFWYFFKSHGFDLYRLGPLGLKKLERYSEKDEFFSTTNYFAKRVPG